MANENERVKFPTVQCDEHYQAGNDYCQTSDMFVSASYQDGIFTEVKDEVSGWEGATLLNVNNILVDANAEYSAADYSVVSSYAGVIPGANVSAY